MEAVRAAVHVLVSVVWRQQHFGAPPPLPVCEHLHLSASDAETAASPPCAVCVAESAELRVRTVAW